MKFIPLIAFILLPILALLFYWYEWRPNTIRSECGLAIMENFSQCEHGGESNLLAGTSGWLFTLLITTDTTIAAGLALATTFATCCN